MGKRRRMIVVLIFMLKGQSILGNRGGKSTVLLLSMSHRENCQQELVGSDLNGCRTVMKIK